MIGLYFLYGCIALFWLLLAREWWRARPDSVRAELARWDWGVLLAWTACLAVGIGSVVSLLRWVSW